MPASAAVAEDDDPFMLLLRSRAIERRRELNIPLETSSLWPLKLDRPPSPNLFCSIVERHVPILIGNCMNDRPAVDKWRDSRYLVDRMGSNRPVTVAVTPHGEADSLVEHNGTEVFALPHEESMRFGDMMERLAAQNVRSQKHSQPGSEVAYLQSQNSNLSVTDYGDLSPLLEDLATSSAQHRSDLTWATQAIGQEPEATNIWIGTSASRTSMHRDHYENLFTVIRGWKEFTVFPPAEGCFLCDDEMFQVYRYHRSADKTLQLKQDADSAPTRWIPIDPTQTKDSAQNKRYTHKDLNTTEKVSISPSSAQTKYGYALRPLKIRVHQGQTLYLPSGWYHHVSQQQDTQVECTDDGEFDMGICLCINWWYEITDEMALRLAEMEVVADNTQHA